MTPLYKMRFVIPSDDYSKEVLKRRFRDSHNTSDGSPFCSITEGFLLQKDWLNEFINDEELKNVCYESYEINDRFLDQKDFLTAFWDGDCEDGDFIPE